jgi:molybdate/tungstate transport system substrate-binding protein
VWPEGRSFAWRTVLVALVASSLAACASTAPAGGSAAVPHRGSPVDVLYAGSLVQLMEQKVGPAFDRATGDRFSGFAGGSVELANEVRSGLRGADVFVSAAPSVNALLEGPAHGGFVGYDLEFATSPLVLAYNPHSRFAPDFRRLPWWQVLALPGFRLGRTDPRLDPKGVLTVRAVEAEAARLHDPGLTDRLLGGTENPAQVFPEEELVGRLEAGQLDAGFFYTVEAQDARLPEVSLAPVREAATFTVTTLAHAPHPAAAVAFVRFLLSRTGSSLLAAGGLHPLVPPRVQGDRAAVPAGLRAVLPRG